MSGRSGKAKVSASVVLGFDRATRSYIGIVPGFDAARSVGPSLDMIEGELKKVLQVYVMSGKVPSPAPPSQAEALKLLKKGRKTLPDFLGIKTLILE